MFFDKVFVPLRTFLPGSRVWEYPTIFHSCGAAQKTKTAKRRGNETEQNLERDLGLYWQKQIRIRQHSSSGPVSMESWNAVFEPLKAPPNSHGFHSWTAEFAPAHLISTSVQLGRTGYRSQERRGGLVVAMGGQVLNHQTICGLINLQQAFSSPTHWR